jgi:superfamily II DNA or RNA helicase
MIIPVVISDMLYIPQVKELADMYSEIKTKFEHKNPEYYKRRAQRRYTGNIYPEIKTWLKVSIANYGNCLAVPRGGTHIISKIAKNYDVQFSWIDNRHQCDPILNMKNNVELWPEQQQLAELMFKQENGIIRSPTGSGKTETLLKVAEWILQTSGPVLIVVWEGNKKSGLFKQWVDRIKMRFGIPEKEIGMIGNNTFRIRPLTVGMQQTLKNMGRRIIYEFGGIICDEIQRFAAPTFQKVVGIYPARYRFGASADETRKDEKEFLIYDMFGRVAGEIEKASLVDKGKIHDVLIRIVPTNFDYRFDIEGTDESISWSQLPSEKKNFNELLSIICDNEERNAIIWKFILPCLKSGNTLMIATARISHAIYWDKKIREAGFNCGLMLGGTENASEFDVTATSLRSRKIQAGIGTIQKIGVGHDIPAWDRGFVLTPLAGNKQVFEQMVGRLRRTCDGKKDAVLYYFWDNPIYRTHKRALAKTYEHNTELFVDGEFLSI